MDAGSITGNTYAKLGGRVYSIPRISQKSALGAKM